ncbi:MAG TPA: hypothetical protein VFY82_09430 [Acidimicrobiales bacterium]|nr:hypothetical protein [Acidimicrobiales bacterium]
MDDRPDDDTVPDPKAEPEGGAASGAGPSAGEGVETTDNGERMLDRDREGDDPEQDAQAEVERMETHNRGRSED